MGVSASRNVASAYSEVTTNIANSINVSANYINDVTQDVNIDCLVRGDVKIEEAQHNVATAEQLSKLMTNTAITNRINQDMMQQAKSLVGALGVGYADASNAATAYSNTSNSVISTVTQSVNEVNMSEQAFQCGPDGRINGNVTVVFTTDNSFIGKQTASSQQLDDITNDVTQSIRQKATATVQGLGFVAALILMMLIMIVMIGVSASKGGGGDKEGDGKKGGMGVGVIVGVGGVFFLIMIILLIWGYVAELPPFFKAPVYISPNASSPVGTCKKQLVNITKRELPLEAAPFRYAYNILNRGKNGSLLELVVITLAGTIRGNNGGMNGQTYLAEGLPSDRTKWVRDTTYHQAGISEPLPNPLVLYELKSNPGNIAKIPAPYIGDVANSKFSCVPGGFSCGTAFNCGQSDRATDCNKLPIQLEPSTDPAFQLAVPNVEGWSKYMAPTGTLDKKRAAHARFVLCRELGLPTDVYVDDTDEVFFKDPDDVQQSGLAKDFGSQVLRLTRFQEWDYTSAITGSMRIEGDYGICDTNLYKVQKNFNEWAIWLVVVILVGAIVGFVISEALKIVKATKKDKDVSTPK